MTGGNKRKDKQPANEGLTSREARRRLDRYGYNTTSDKKRLSPMAAYLLRFRNPLSVILLLAAVSSFFLGEYASGLIIFCIVIISTTLDFVNTYRSEKAAAALQRSVRVNAQVLRDHKIKSIPLANIVPGDVVSLQAGSIIPADGVVLNSTDLTIDESALTGETFPVYKPIDGQVYMGSSAVSGSGTMLVTATGHQTEFARIASNLNQDTPTEFDLEIARFSMLIARITFGLVIFILAVNLLFRRDAIDALLFALALAVGLTPELLPLIITINLTKGSLRMAKKGVIIKKLSAIQNFGSMDVLCTDKTGTLTQNQIAVARTQDINLTESRRVLDLAAAVCQYSTSYENPLDQAILKFQKYNFRRFRKVQEIPFDFMRKRESVVVVEDGQTVLISKGAADAMMSALGSYRDANGTAKRMTVGAAAKLRQAYADLSSEGYRVLAVASRPVSHQDKYTKDDEADLTFEGYIAFIDPPKASAKKSLDRLAQHNIEVKIITGDDPLVAQKVASDLQINVKGVMTGDQIAKLNKLQLARKVDQISIFARVNPSQKLAVIEALRHRGHVVGYMGDGINDAPSLRTADVGISVNNAVDVAKDTADVILMGQSLAYLNDGVIEGRRTFANTMKYLKMALSSNFGNMFSMAGSSLLLPFLPMTAPQILLNNLLYDTSQFALPSDNVDDEQLTRPHRMDMAAIKKFMWVFGSLSSLFDFITFGVLMLVFHTGASQFQTGWFIESLLTQTLVVFIFRTRRFALASRPSKGLMLSIAAIVIIAGSIALSSLGQYLGFTPLPLEQLTAIALITICYLTTAEIIKHAFNRHLGERV